MNKFTVRPNKSVIDIIDINRGIKMVQNPREANRAFPRLNKHELAKVHIMTIGDE